MTDHAPDKAVDYQPPPPVVANMSRSSDVYRRKDLARNQRRTTNELLKLSTSAEIWIWIWPTSRDRFGPGGGGAL